MQYKIIKNQDPQAVVDKVNKDINNGWKISGGLAVSTVFMPSPLYRSVTEYAQAMTKD